MISFIYLFISTAADIFHSRFQICFNFVMTLSNRNSIDIYVKTFEATVAMTWKLFTHFMLRKGGRGGIFQIVSSKVDLECPLWDYRHCDRYRN